MSSLSSQNRIIAPILLGVGILLSVILLKPAYSSYVENNITLKSLKTENTKLTEEYTTLKNIRDNISTNLSPEKQARIKKLTKPFNVSDIMSIILLNNFTKDSATQSAPISIGNISVTPGNKLPSGLSLGSVSFALQGKTISDIIAYITSLTQTGEYIFTLDSISLPIDTAPESIQSGGYALSITLGIYYY